MEEAYIYLTLARLILPLSILKWPLFGVILSALLDYQDWGFLSVTTEKESMFYQNWDKLMDTYYLSLAWIVSLAWKDKIAKYTSSALFFWRALGIPAAIILDRSFLILFPNIFEWFFMFYLFFVFIRKQNKLFLRKTTLVIILIALSIPKITQEYFMHVLRRFPWDVFDPYTHLGLDTIIPGIIDWPMWIWVAGFSFLPILALSYTLKFVPKKKETKI